MKKLTYEKQTKRFVAVAGLLLLAACPAMAQISYKAVDKHEQLKKQSLREANQTEATYKDTHLNMEAYTFKKGGFGKAEKRSRGKLLRPVDAPDQENVQRAPAQREKKFRLFRKKDK
jgi:hypothetical protein